MACFLQAAILDHMWTWRSHSFGVLPGSWRKTSSFLRHSSFVGNFTSIFDALVAIEHFTAFVFLKRRHDRSALRCIIHVSGDLTDYEYEMVHIRSDTNGGMPVMFTQVVVISRLNALLAEYDQRSLLNSFIDTYANGQFHHSLQRASALRNKCASY